MKTPEELAEEYCEDHDECEHARNAFLAGYQAGKEAMLNTQSRMDGAIDRMFQRATGNSPKKLDSWISVKERLPEIPDTRSMSDDVLWLTRYGEMEVSCLERLRSEFRVDWGEAGLLKLDQFTHWQPLPKPPEDK